MKKVAILLVSLFIITGCSVTQKDNKQPETKTIKQEAQNQKEKTQKSKNNKESNSEEIKFTKPKGKESKVVQNPCILFSKDLAKSGLNISDNFNKFEKDEGIPNSAKRCSYGTETIDGYFYTTGISIELLHYQTSRAKKMFNEELKNEDIKQIYNYPFGKFAVTKDNTGMVRVGNLRLMHTKSANLKDKNKEKKAPKFSEEYIDRFMNNLKNLDKYQEA